MAGIGKWKRLLKEALDDPWNSSINGDHPECPHCGGVMNFFGHDENGDFDYGEGYWECPGCNFIFKEDEL